MQRASYLFTIVCLILAFPFLSLAQWVDFQPGDYATVSKCTPFQGSASSPLKIFFVNYNNAPQFDKAVRLAVNKQFKTTSPFKEHFSDIAFYKVALKGNYNCTYTPSAGGKIMSCDGWRFRGMVGQVACNISDPNAPVVIVMNPGEYRASSQDVIYEPLGKAKSKQSQVIYQDLFLATIVHEVSHTFGLGDLYVEHPKTGLVTGPYGLQNRSFVPNVDAPGCSKWCASYKSVAQYPASKNSACMKFTTKQSCINYNGKPSSNKSDEKACVWSDQPFEYFGTNCIPMWGTSNIGEGCISGTGCYLGANMGQYSWRPVKNCTDSKMCNARIKKYDPVSGNVMNKAFTCCLSSQDVSTECQQFRSQIATTLRSFPTHRLGSCGSYLPYY